MKYILSALTLIFILSGCSAKKINGNVDSISNDITNVFEGSTDNSK